MPNYNAQNPPPVLYPGDVGWSFGASAVAAIAASTGGLANASGTVTITTSTAHNFKAGQYVRLQGVNSTSGFLYDGEYQIQSVPSSTTFTISQPRGPNGDTGGGGNATSIAGEAPAPPQAGQQFALAQAYDGAAGGDAEVRVDLSYVSAPASVSVLIQRAIDDADGSYITEYTSTNTAGESVKLTALRARFLRVKLSAQSGGGALFARVER
jgi:hypothetical protein